MRDGGIRVSVHATPGARSPRVGGRYGDGDVLRVAVRERATDGRANTALLRALAAAFDVPTGAVRLLHGASGRDKVVLVEGDPAVLTARRRHLLGPGPAS